jgi:hypothetical protein
MASCATVKKFTPNISLPNFSRLKEMTPDIPMPSFSTLKKITPDIPMPSFSTLKKITNILPGMPGRDTASADDPKVPFNARGTLGYGHTLRLHAYEGTRSPKRIFNGVVMVDEKGIVQLGKAGSARIGGTSLPKAAETIAATFRIGMSLGRTVTVHILSVEDTPVVSIRGDVMSDEFVPAWEDMTLEQAVRVSGGRKTGSTHHGVYLIREGVRRYFSSIEQANEEEPEPGDIIELSPDI